MALDLSQRAQLEAHVGPLDEDDLDDMSERLKRLGVIEAVALEVIKTRLAQMRMTPAEFSAQGDARIVHKENVPWLLEAIDTLVQYMGTLSLNSAAQALVDSVTAVDDNSGTQSIDVFATAPRKG